ncbi:hypothetical protein GCM10027610_085340 [Dactylosporangium cerinum]
MDVVREERRQLDDRHAGEWPFQGHGGLVRPGAAGEHELVVALEQAADGGQRLAVPAPAGRADPVLGVLGEFVEAVEHR